MGTYQYEKCPSASPSDLSTISPAKAPLLASYRQSNNPSKLASSGPSISPTLSPLASSSLITVNPTKKLTTPTTTKRTWSLKGKEGHEFKTKTTRATFSAFASNCQSCKLVGNPNNVLTNHPSKQLSLIASSPEDIASSNIYLNFVFSYSPSWHMSALAMTSGDDTSSFPSKIEVYGRNTDVDEWTKCDVLESMTWNEINQKKVIFIKNFNSYQQYRVALCKVPNTNTVEVSGIHFTEEVLASRTDLHITS